MKINKKVFYLIIALAIVAVLVYSPKTGYTGIDGIIPQSFDINDDNAEICFQFGMGDEIGPGDYLEIEFASGFDLTNLNISDTSTDSEIGTYYFGITCTRNRIFELTQTPDNNRDFAEVDGNILRLVFEDDPGVNFSISITEEDDGDALSLGTPSSAGNYQVTYRWGTGTEVTGVDADLIYIGGANQVDISAAVDPVLSLSLSANTCALGTFGTDKVNTCNYATTVTTNATSGYTASMKEETGFTDGSHVFTDITSGIGPNNTSIDFGYEEYGVATDSAYYAIADIDQQITNANCIAYDEGTTAVPAADLDGTTQSYHGSTGPVTDDECNICHAASIDGSTPAGVYSHTITITIVGNF